MTNIDKLAPNNLEVNCIPSKTSIAVIANATDSEATEKNEKSGIISRLKQKIMQEM